MAKVYHRIHFHSGLSTPIYEPTSRFASPASARPLKRGNIISTATNGHKVGNRFFFSAALSVMRPGTGAAAVKSCQSHNK